METVCILKVFLKLNQKPLAEEVDVIAVLYTLISSLPISNVRFETVVTFSLFSSFPPDQCW